MVRLITLTCAWRWLQPDGLLQAPEDGIAENRARNHAPIRPKLVILRAMNRPKDLLRARKLRIIAVVPLVIALALITGCFYLWGQDKSDFPDGYDAVQAAPNSHKVIFENALVRVLEVTVPPPGTTIPMHHHRWPSFFLDWDTGGGTPHIRYHRPDGSVRDNPGADQPIRPGAWSVHWMNPEPMHAIEVVALPKSAATLPPGPPSLRIEIKCHP
jgi:hypothetical protein